MCMNAWELFLCFLESLEFIFVYFWSIIFIYRNSTSTLFGAWDTAMLYEKGGG